MIFVLDSLVQHAYTICIHIGHTHFCMHIYSKMLHFSPSTTNFMSWLMLVYNILGHHGCWISPDVLEKKPKEVTHFSLSINRPINVQDDVFQCLDQQSKTPKHSIWKYIRSKHQILTLEKLEQRNVWHFCLIVWLKWLTNYQNSCLFHFLTINY